LAQWDLVNNINARGVFLCTREEIKAMLKNKPISAIEGRPPARGAIVNVGSVASKVGTPGNVAYASSKHVRFLAYLP
jgi:NAD(P)-dependent dehydrogenase (short-subunit alcohol dehydrogenase family)